MHDLCTYCDVFRLSVLYSRSLSLALVTHLAGCACLKNSRENSLVVTAIYLMRTHLKSSVCRNIHAYTTSIAATKANHQIRVKEKKTK